jgi:hypothetical protein
LQASWHVFPNKDGQNAPLHSCVTGHLPVRKLCAKYQQKTSINCDKMFWLLCFSIFLKDHYAPGRVYSAAGECK